MCVCEKVGFTVLALLHVRTYTVHKPISECFAMIT